MDNFVQLIKPHFSKVKSLPNLEIELRLGKLNGKYFDTNVGEKVFSKILESLYKYSEWEEIKEINSTSYFIGEKRMDINEDTDERNSFIKKRLTKIDHVIPGQPLDVRFSTAQELPIDELDCDQEMDSMRCKQRKSFIRKNLSIDMTIVSKEPDDPDDESENFYEIELEIIDPQKVKNDKEFYNLIYKVQCILNTL